MVTPPVIFMLNIAFCSSLGVWILGLICALQSIVLSFSPAEGELPVQNIFIILIVGTLGMTITLIWKWVYRREHP